MSKIVGAAAAILLLGAGGAYYMLVKKPRNLTSTGPSTHTISQKSCRTDEELLSCVSLDDTVIIHCPPLKDCTKAPQEVIFQPVNCPAIPKGYQTRDFTGYPNNEAGSPVYSDRIDNFEYILNSYCNAQPTFPSPPFQNCEDARCSPGNRSRHSRNQPKFSYYDCTEDCYIPKNINTCRGSCNSSGTRFPNPDIFDQLEADCCAPGFSRTMGNCDEIPISCCESGTSTSYRDSTEYPNINIKNDCCTPGFRDHNRKKNCDTSRSPINTSTVMMCPGCNKLLNQPSATRSTRNSQISRIPQNIRRSQTSNVHARNARFSESTNYPNTSQNTNNERASVASTMTYHEKMLIDYYQNEMNNVTFVECKECCKKSQKK